MERSVIFHIHEPPKWDTLLHNVANLLESAAPATVRVEVLANGPAVGQYAAGVCDAAVQAMSSLAGRGVHFAACRNALRGLGIDTGRLPSFVQVVPAGVLELVERQVEGYAYIKP